MSKQMHIPYITTDRIDVGKINETPIGYVNAAAIELSDT